jgi:hypothetical protein
MLENVGRETMRAADTDRQQVAERLRAALDEGRLDLSEYDERLQQAYAARTYGDLDRLLADLPLAAPGLPAVPTAQAPVPAGGAVPWLGHVWGPWARTALVVNLVWGVTSVVTQTPQYYWPFWVMVPWGIVLLLRSAGGLLSGEPVKHRRAAEFQLRLREHKRERRALEARAIARGELPATPTKEQRRQFAAEAIARGDLAPRPQPADGER